MTMRAWLDRFVRRLKKHPLVMRYKEWLITQGTVLCMCGMFGLVVTGIFVFWGVVFLLGAVMVITGILALYETAPNPPDGGIPHIVEIKSRAVCAALSMLILENAPAKLLRNVRV